MKKNICDDQYEFIKTFIIVIFITKEKCFNYFRTNRAVHTFRCDAKNSISSTTDGVQHLWCFSS